MVRCYLPILLFLSFITPCLPHPGDSAKFNASTKSAFIENKGQIIDQKNNPNPAVLYLLNTPGFNVQLRRGGFSYDVYSVSSRQSAVHGLPLASGIRHPLSDIEHRVSSITELTSTC